MGKVKSALLFTLIVLIIAVLCVVCFVPFPVGWNEEGEVLRFYNPIINWAEKSADFGGYQYGATPDYLGGSYSVVFYPEGVISAKEYADNESEASEEEDKTEYVPYANGAIYLDKEAVCGGGEEPTDEFKANFEQQRKILRTRFEELHSENMTLEVCDGYTFRATLPATMDASVAAFLYFSYMGEVTVSYGSSSDVASATQIIPEPGVKAKPVGEYIKSATMHNTAGNIYVLVDFTDAGLDLIGSATSAAASSAGYLFIQVGEETVINLSVSEAVTDDLYISGSYTSDSATIVATTIDTALRLGGSGDSAVGALKMGDLARTEANFAPLTIGSLSLGALDLVYIAFGVLFVAMAVFFLVRYGMLGFAHICTYLIFLLAMVLIYWAVPIAIGVGTLTAFAIASLLLCVFDAVAYEYARKEFAVGKTIASSVKTGYKKCFWHVFDVHIVLLILSLLVYLIAVTELSLFGLALLFGVAVGAICTLAINRFLWYLMMSFTKNPGKFCRFKREEVDDDD